MVYGTEGVVANDAVLSRPVTRDKYETSSYLIGH
jgi:hypothetical protein